MTPLTRRELLRFMRTHGACAEATAWVRRTKGTPAQLWRKCPHWAWLDWAVDELNHRDLKVPQDEWWRTDKKSSPDTYRRALPWRRVGPHVARAVRR